MAIEFLHSLDVAGDLKVEGKIKDAEGVDRSSNWNTAYSWGDHSLAGYLTSASNFYTQGVTFDTDNGILLINVKGTTNRSVDLDGRYLVKSHQGGDDYFGGHHPENRILANAALANDLANLTLRGGSVNVTGTTVLGDQLEKMFNGIGTVANIAVDQFNPEIVIECVIPRTLRYSLYVGIGFGHPNWRCKNVKIEAYSENKWLEVFHDTNNIHADIYVNVPGNSGVGTTKFRFTLSDPNAGVRIAHIWAYNYDSRMWSEAMMPRAGGTMYGALTINGTLNNHTIPSGTGTLALTSDIPTKAADSEKLDGIDSSRFIYGDNATGTDAITGAQFNPSGHLKSGFYKVNKTSSTIPNATSVNFAIHTSYSSEGNTAGFDIAVNDSTTSPIYYRSATGGGRGNWHTFFTTGNFTDNSTNWDTAYGWGNHADAGYGTSSFDGKYSSLSGIPTTFAPSSHNHDTRYLRKDVADTSMGMKVFETTLTNKDDWENSPISIGERDNVRNTKSDDKYAPNLNFHWRGVVSKSLWMGANGHLVWGEFNAEGVPQTDGTFKTGTLYAGAQSITATKVNNWNTAYGWGDHGSEGYLTALPTHNHDGRYLRTYARYSNNLSSIASSGVYVWDVSEANDEPTGAADGLLTVKYWDSSSWATASFQDFHNRKLYITSKKSGTWLNTWAEVHTTDTFAASDVAKGVTAHGYGNHADAGYITSVPTVTNVSGYSGTLNRQDNRVISPSEETAGRLKFGFTSWANNDTAPYADFLHLRSYTDSSGGNDNLVMFKKSGIGMRIWQQGWGSASAYESYEDVWTTGDFSSTKVSNWNTAYGWGDHSAAGYVTRSAPTKPVVSSKIVNDTIEVTITASTTANIDQYLVFSSVVGSDFGLISVIPPEDFSATMSVIDNSFDESGKIDYRVYAVKNGVYSSASTTTQTFSAGTLEPTNMSVINLNTAHYIQWDAPSSKSRFVKKYEVYHHEHDSESSLSRGSATLIYSGLNTSYMRKETNTKFHQFWVEIDEA